MEAVTVATAPRSDILELPHSLFPIYPPSVQASPTPNFERYDSPHFATYRPPFLPGSWSFSSTPFPSPDVITYSKNATRIF